MKPCIVQYYVTERDGTVNNYMLLVQNYEILFLALYVSISMSLGNCERCYGVPCYTVVQGDIIVVRLGGHT